MSMSITISEDQVAEAIWHGELSFSDILGHLATERTSDGEEERFLVDLAEAGKALSDRKRLSQPLRTFGAALDALATDHQEHLLKGETS
ncbi:hypothetical protein JYP51_09545 [Ponticoccus gilvus]|nr:hypothetical protein [Enemella evansiae]